ncbi:MAG TPA: hypothetical protein VL426_05210 [Candidatus Binatia bacterium]|jgi:hypothetical protein|nr:hypothetical protein [Candidatus Binatia bacterium]
MYLVGHAAIGMALASGTDDPVLAFGIGWLSHYLADFVPHGDEPAGEWAKRGNEVKRLMVLLLVDGALFFAAFAWFTSRRGFHLAAATAALGSFVPDVLWGLGKVLKRPVFGPLEKFHNFNHNFFHVKLPLWFGLIGQAALAGSLWTWLTLR